MVEHDRLGILRAPVLVKDFSAVLGGYSAHGLVSFDSGWGHSVGGHTKCGWECRIRSSSRCGEQRTTAGKWGQSLSHFSVLRYKLCVSQSLGPDRYRDGCAQFLVFRSRVLDIPDFLFRRLYLVISTSVATASA
ncbi:hypothetical protein D3C80_824620 [compost metagenome]